MADGQHAGGTFLCGSIFGAVAVVQENGVRRIVWDGGQGPVLNGSDLWLRGTYHGDTGHLFYSVDGKTYTDTGETFSLTFKDWKGARLGIFCFGNYGGSVDVDWVHYTYSDSGASAE